MAIQRYQSPFSALQQLDREMNELTSRLFGRSGREEWPERDAVFAAQAKSIQIESG